MTDVTAEYPSPLETPANEPLLAAWRAGRLALQRCTECKLVYFYPRSLCPRCWSTAVEWFTATGLGTVASYTFIERPLHPAFVNDVPIVLAEIEVDEGARMLARVIAANQDGMRTGARVRLLALPDARRYPLPTFELSTDER